MVSLTSVFINSTLSERKLKRRTDVSNEKHSTSRVCRSKPSHAYELSLLPHPHPAALEQRGPLLGSCKIYFALKSMRSHLKPRALKGFKTVKMVQERRLISGTALPQLHKVVPLSLICSSLYISYAGISPACFFLSPSAPPHPTPPPTSATAVNLTPRHHPSSFANIYFCISSFPPLLLPRLPYLPLAPLFVPLPSSVSEVREGAGVPGGMRFVFRGRRGRGRIVSEGEGTRSVKGIKGRTGGESVK